MPPRWRGKYCFASRAKQIIGGYPKTITFLTSPEFTVVAKCKARFIKKISQLKSDIQSGRCKNFSLKQLSGMIGNSKTLTEIEVKNGQCFCKKQVGNNFSWSMLLSTIEMSSKCSKLFGSWFHLNFEHFDLISLADKSIRRKNERFIGL